MPPLSGTPLINGIRHAWANVAFNMLGRTVTGISEIKYQDDVDIENNYGAGSYPVSRGMGNYTPTASIKLEKYEVEALMSAAGGLRLQEIEPFDIVVAYIPVGQDTLKTDVIRNCQFKTNMRDLKSGDKKIDVSTDLIISHILWDGMTE